MPSTFKDAVILLVMEILLGSIFILGAQYWNTNVSREFCTLVKTQLGDSVFGVIW